ncbi:MAG: T9SS type A sorting domain-containing protein, partial [Bacteroidota bacterium]
DSIVVNNVSLTGVNLTFFTLTPNLFHDVIHKADSMAAANLPADRSLRRISGWEVDIQGRARSWEFAYSINGNTQGKSIHLGTMDYSIDDIDPMYFQWLSTMKEITNYDLAASSAAVIANVEAAGGTMVREQPIPSQWEFAIELSLSDQKNGWFGGSGAVDTSKIYWAAAYAYNYQVNPDQNQWMGGRLFLCDFATGSVLDTRDIIMDVKNEPTTVREFRLSQNYPNPFNPTTVIEFTVAQRAPATLKIFNVLGQEVAELFNSTAEPGQKYKVVFNAKNLSSGIYFSRLESNGRSELKKLVLLR